MDNKILVVDDIPVNRMIISKYVEQCGYKTIESDNGKNAIQTLNKNQDICLILVDVQMPIMNGIEMTVKMRENGVKIPIIGITGYVDELTIKLCEDAGMNRVLCKPINKEVLLDIVNDLKK